MKTMIALRKRTNQESILMKTMSKIQIDQIYVMHLNFISLESEDNYTFGFKAVYKNL